MPGEGPNLRDNIAIHPLLVLVAILGLANFGLTQFTSTAPDRSAFLAQAAAAAATSGGACEQAYNKCMTDPNEKDKNMCETNWRNCVIPKCREKTAKGIEQCPKDPDCESSCTEAAYSQSGILGCCVGGPKHSNKCTKLLDGKCVPPGSKPGGTQQAGSGSPGAPQIPSAAGKGGNDTGPLQQSAANLQLQPLDARLEAKDSSESKAPLPENGSFSDIESDADEYGGEDYQDEASIPQNAQPTQGVAPENIQRLMAEQSGSGVGGSDAEEAFKRSGAYTMTQQFSSGSTFSQEQTGGFDSSNQETSGWVDSIRDAAASTWNAVRDTTASAWEGAMDYLGINQADTSGLESIQLDQSTEFQSMDELQRAEVLMVNENAADLPTPPPTEDLPTNDRSSLEAQSQNQELANESPNPRRDMLENPDTIYKTGSSDGAETQNQLLAPDQVSPQPERSFENSCGMCMQTTLSSWRDVEVSGIDTFGPNSDVSTYGPFDAPWAPPAQSGQPNDLFYANAGDNLPLNPYVTTGPNEFPSYVTDAQNFSPQEFSNRPGFGLAPESNDSGSSNFTNGNSNGQLPPSFDGRAEAPRATFVNPDGSSGIQASSKRLDNRTEEPNRSNYDYYREVSTLDPVPIANRVPDSLIGNRVSLPPNIGNVDAFVTNQILGGFNAGRAFSNYLFGTNYPQLPYYRYR